jgi:hypothetical protein
MVVEEAGQTEVNSEDFFIASFVMRDRLTTSNPFFRKNFLAVSVRRTTLLMWR